MKFKIDGRYIALLTLESIASYLIALVVLFFMLHKQNPMEFMLTSMAAMLTVYFGILFPRSIIVKDGKVSFTGNNGLMRTDVGLMHITDVEISTDHYNTVTIHTDYGNTYKLHPKDAEGLVKAIRRV